MTIDRRRVLSLAGAALASGLVRPAWGYDVDEPTVDRLHPITRSLLERARRIDRSRPADRDAIERTVRQYAGETGWTKPLVIEWMETPMDVHGYLSSLGLDALLDMGSAKFWRRTQPPVTCDVETFDRAFEAKMLADKSLGVDEHDRLLMTPKLLTKSQAVSTNASNEEVFRVRAISAQIGWLETSITDAATEAIANVEQLLSTGASEGSVAINHQMMVFEAHEHGLLATWETHGALICAVRSRFRHD